MKIVAFCLLCLISSGIYSQNKNGFVDHEKITKMLPEYNDSQKRLANFLKQAEDSMQIFFKHFECNINALHCRSLMDSITKANEEKKLNSHMENLEQYRESAQTTYFIMKDTEDKFLRERELFYLRAFCQKYEISFIVEQKAVLYCEDCVDYTLPVMNYLKEQ